MKETTLDPSNNDNGAAYYYYDGYQGDFQYTGSSSNGTSNTTFYYGGGIYDYSDETRGIYYYEGFDFERPVFLYVWVILIIVTSLANILVMVVLQRKNMRNATNTILIAVAISDSMTGLVTLPVTIYAYQQYEEGDLALTKEWCEAFMITRYFINRGFHTMSIWLTVVLGFQRLISVSFPFRAQRIFTIRNTVIIILIVVFLAPFLHIYHAFDKKAVEDEDYGNYCRWNIENPCQESCIYFWLMIILMHFIPCILLVIFTITMVVTMNDATRKMKDSQMIANKANLHRRHMESKRISCIVIAVVIVFLIPEIPYGIFLLVQVCLRHSNKNLLEVKTSRALICAYEILLVLSFHANFWIYLIMNRKFRRGLRRTFEPVEALLYTILWKCGIRRQRPRILSDTTSLGLSPSEAQSMPTQTGHSRISQTSSLKFNTNALEMRTYHFNKDIKAKDIQL